MRIAIIYNPPKADTDEGWLVRSSGKDDSALRTLQQAADHGVLGQVELIRCSLLAADHEVTLCGARTASELWEFLAGCRPELVFNCCEAFAERTALEMNVAALLELLAIPFTGSPALTLALALHKPLMKALLTANGIATPAHVVVEPGGDPACARGLAYPLIVKPVAEDASIGIDDHAVVHDEPSLAARVSFVWRELGQAALVEELIDGRELNVSLLAASPHELEVLPLGEIVFDALPVGRPRIVGYDAKWNPHADFQQATAARCPAELDLDAAERVRRTALAAARVCGLRDYGRVEVRLHERSGTPYVIELNPNPDLNVDCEFMRAARASGRTDPRAICEIVERALERQLAGELPGASR